MKNVYKFLFIIGLLSLSTAFVMGQEDDVISRLKTQLLLYRTQKTDQVVVVQTDKTLYRQGETIWMKGYVTDAITHYFALNSIELSAQLIDNKGVSVLEGKILIRNGIADFNFTIPADLPSDIYYLVAYTPEMENSGIETIFKKEIIIAKPENFDMIPHLDYSKPAYAPDCKETATIRLINISGKPVASKKFEYQIFSDDREILSGKGKTGANGTGEVVFFTPPAQNGNPLLASLTIPSGKDRINLVSKVPLLSEKINITFFPDGGKLIPGIPQSVVYEAKDQLGNPVSIKADIIDEKDNILVSTETIQPGLGAFNLLNSDGKIPRMRIRIVSDIGRNQETSLPAASPGSMSITPRTQEKNNLSLLLGRSPKSEAAKFKIVAVCNGEMIWASDFDLEQSGVINIPLDNFHSAIAALAVFSQKGELVGQRLIYTGKSQPLSITFTPDKSSYKVEDSGEIRIKITDAEGKPVRAELAVCLADKTTLLESSTMVEVLNYGLDKPFPTGEPLEKLNRTTLDYFLAVNSLKGFDWNQVLAMDPAKGTKARNNSIRISGTVVDERNLPVPNSLVSLTSTSLQQFNGSTNQHGEFVINVPVSVDKKNLSASATNGTGKGNFRVILNKSFKDELINSLNNIKINNWQILDQLYQKGYFTENPDYFKARSFVKIRNEEKKVTEPYWKRYINGSTNLLDIVKSIRPFELMNNKIVFRGVNSFMAQDGALIVLDGQKLGTDASALTSINPNDIEDIRILVDPSEIVMYTGLNSVGIIEIKSKHGGSSAKTEETTDTVVKDGALKSFTPEAIGEKKYDLKTTLQWIPGLLTDGNGEAIVSFKTGAIKSSFTLEIAGFTDQRRWIQAQTEIRIK